MAISRFPVAKYASIELNQVAFPWNGHVVSQMPLSTDFTAAAPCENGMWLDCDKAAEVVKPVSADTKVYGIAYTAEREYGYDDVGLQNHCWVSGDYPRVGILSKGDTITSNCFCYDTTEFATETALLTACAACKTTALYVVPVTASTAPKLTATAPASGAYGKVVKYYTMPNGETGLKYEIYNA